jgi:hypothetical protein
LITYALFPTLGARAGITLAGVLKFTTTTRHD